MAKNLSLKQYVYKYPDDNTFHPEDFVLGEELFDPSTMLEIFSVGIQAPQGTKFTINGQEGRIGPTNVFELDGLIPIYSLTVGETDSLNSRIIVDILYTKRGE